MAGGRTIAQASLGQIYGGSASRRAAMAYEEIQDVLAWRKRNGGGWQAAANYCGRSVEEVRRACGGGVAAVERPAVVAPVAPPVGRPVKVSALPAANRTREQWHAEAKAGVVAAMSSMPRSMGEIADACGKSKPFVRKTVLAMVEDGEAAFGGYRAKARGARVELWVKAKTR